MKKHCMKMKQQSLFRLSKRPKERKKPPNSKTFKNNTKDGEKRNAKKCIRTAILSPLICVEFFSQT